jgi:sugar (pentulose or hexulose) kinase
MIADWMVHRLTGTLVSEPSIGSTSGLFELGSRAWRGSMRTSCSTANGFSAAQQRQVERPRPGARLPG